MEVSRRRLLRGGVAAFACTALPLRSLGLLFPVAASAAPGSAGGALDLATFSGLVGSTFQADVGGARASLRLAAATAGPKATRKGQCFSLLFGAESGGRFAQGTYAFTHPSLGSFPLFVVPVGQAQATPLYEAVFNRV